MSTKAGVDFDGLMRHLMVVGFAALTAWVAASATGMALGVVRISPSATLRFLLAILVLVFARRTYWEIQEWRWRRLPPDERYGFASPIREHPRSAELDRAGSTPTEEPEGEPEPRR
jgi:type VI protein secretion system component VasK